MVQTIVGMSWYTREDYWRIRQIMSDADKLHDIFDEWQAAAERGERDLQLQGPAANMPISLRLGRPGSEHKTNCCLATCWTHARRRPL
jgi:hypothetical protein